MTLTTHEMQARVRREVGMPSRLGHAALLTVAAIVGGVVTSLLVTERGLPPRTQWAFAVIVVIAAAWIVYAVWVLMRRRVLLGTQRIAAAGLACLFTSVACVGSIILRPHVGFGAVLTTGALMVAAGVAMWRATRHVKRLQALARELEGAGAAR